MPMNLAHRVLCRSSSWNRSAEREFVPWTLEHVELGDHVLEIGPGFGATTRVLVDIAPRLTAVEIDLDSAARLQRIHGEAVEVVCGDATALDLPDDSYSAAVCFTMLHHVPDAVLQDRLFSEAYRVLRPGGVFAGSDSRASLRMRMLHIGDTYVPVDPARLPDRLRRAGYEDVHVDSNARRFRFRARKPA
ncbi:class I SAM-dependent methyltransferase [Rhodococcus sp. D2-41]|uniref:class I SAM-dependent methyltransferase n=1 Tax=Speluncibacter jeojiensis TaxID=2710754 RepID=UPI00240F4A6A|nr:class I SAM-dependent methyltransferase [Rhodococcus sp. D2-41]MDG3012867.1 class I SAM-dependent methyltransferase [Rhodococcus sp. D2-41]